MIIAERYEILAKIGTGGMADVYKATDHKLNRFVAVKVLKPEFREDTTFIRKFRSEAQAAAGLTHPNIVNVYDVGDDEGVNYIVMELIEGITLKEYISKKSKLSVKEATSIAIQVSMGLEAAHSHGIVHRDIKPQNIIISTDGKVKVTDFGIARAASSNTISSNVMGSVHYSSPEQVRGGYSDEKSDIYSLGITLYEMVTGKVPFDGDTTVAIAIKHLQEEMVPPSVYTEDLPNSLEQIILKCTQKSVSRRYERMEDLIADLKHSLIDPQGDFVKLSPENNDGKTVVISDEELGKIKSTPKSSMKLKSEVEDLEEESYHASYDEEEEDEDEDEDDEDERRRERRRNSQKRRSAKRIVTIAALLIGAGAMVGVIFAVGKASGLFGGSDDATSQVVEQPAEEEDDNLVEVPDLTGRTEEEAAELTAGSLGLQLMGEEASTQEKGRISSQEITAGSKVEKNTTLKYYVSKGTEEIQIPSMDGVTGIEAQKTLEDLGLNVTVEKAYSEVDDTDYPVVEPGFVYSVYPEVGSSVRSGDSVTLTISRGADRGDEVYVPDVEGMTRDNAITTLGKWLTINVTYAQSTEVAEGEVISQSPEAESYADPDGEITIVVSSGDQDPAQAEAAAETSSEDEPQYTEQEQQAIANGETWKCTQSLNTPEGYQNGLVRLELIQQVGGVPTATVVLEGQALTFPYELDITGAPGVEQGELHLFEQIDGEYIELGKYTITFEKAE
jgi:serine/threonine-protein kinase